MVRRSAVTRHRVVGGSSDTSHDLLSALLGATAVSSYCNNDEGAQPAVTARGDVRRGKFGGGGNGSGCAGAGGGGGCGSGCEGSGGGGGAGLLLKEQYAHKTRAIANLYQKPPT